MRARTIGRAWSLAVVMCFAVPALASCVQAPPSQPAPVPSTPPVLVWYRVDPMIETACTPWGDRLFRADAGTGGWSIAVAPDSRDASPCGYTSGQPNYGPGAQP